MKIRLFHDVMDHNSHGTQTKGHPWNGEMVRGWKVKAINLRKANGWKPTSRAIFYWRFILYLPSGAWHHLDVVLS